ncbi:TDT family transporter [Subtercola sp. RTI3]|uniref:TDT family transporter n=1 Tax=Subtercola sp. RTI3 TaxID=3048639 RepID=UPI002B22CD61|nr:TDT family transporter [Subtercola sp. RTI3]MEA9984208.1 TDT family transporter [Subtercola sp. RTI3]
MSTAQALRPAAPSRMFLRELERPMHMFRNITPNWYASVMGTGIVANAAATVIHWVTNRQTARTHHLNPVMAHFYGAPAMALLTVGAGTILLGRDVLGEQTAVAVDAVLWTLGTIMGLATAVAVPYLTFTKFTVAADSAFGGWLMPIVPPMVSASTGALLIPYLPDGQARLTMLLACYAMFGLSLVASLIVITLIWSRLTTHKIGVAAMVPTLWIVLGPLGQSVTAVNLLGGNAHLATTAPLAEALQAFGVIYGVPVLGFAALWAALALAITLRTAREHLPFSLTWWSFTFPVGTCVTGLTGVALHTGSVAFQAAAVLAFAALLGAWAVVAIRTFRGSALTGTLFVPPAAKIG